MGWHGVEESLLSNAMRGAVAVQQSRVLGKSEGPPPRCGKQMLSRPRNSASPTNAGARRES